MKSPRKTIAISGLIVAFIVSEVCLYRWADRPVAQYMAGLDGAHPSVVSFFLAITDFGKAVWYLVPSGLALIFCSFLVRGKDVPTRYRRLFGYVGTRALFLFTTVALSGIAADILKPLIGRSRPVLFLQSGIYDFSPLTSLGSRWNSFPSGHTTTAFALACSLTVLYPRLRIVWFSLAFLILFSRLVVHAHYPSDACAGALLGWLTVLVVQGYVMKPVSTRLFPPDVLSHPHRAQPSSRRRI